MFPQGRSLFLIAKWLLVFLLSGIRASWCFSHVDVVTLGTFDFICYALSMTRSFSIRSTYRAVFSFTLSRFTPIRSLEQSLNCNASLFYYFDLETLPFYSFWYFLSSCEFGVAGTKMTASFLPRLYQSFFFLAFSCSRSSFFHSLGRCSGRSPSWSASFLVLYALRAESTTSYLNFLLYTPSTASWGPSH